jgi:hypothetical protein
MRPGILNICVVTVKDDYGLMVTTMRGGSVIDRCELIQVFYSDG